MTPPSREALLHALPYARRYARALSGSQAAGDRLVADAIRDLLAGDGHGEPARLALYAHVTRRFDQAGDAADPHAMDGVPLRQRQLLLLTSLEDVSLAEAARVIGVSPEIAAEQLEQARARMREAAATDVLIIEDEPIIALDLEELVRGCGHRVVGVASSEAEAIDIARRTRPGLILADINLGAGGDGTKAVASILTTHVIPVVFVTAYPERLLTGSAIEPAFVITKPFEPLTLAIATYQAVTGGLLLDQV